MFGIGFSELCIIVVVALVVVGPQRMPEMMRQLGKFFVQMRRMSSDVKASVEQVIQEAEQEIRQDDQKKLEAAIARKAAQAAEAQSQPVLEATPVSLPAGSQAAVPAPPPAASDHETSTPVTEEACEATPTLKDPFAALGSHDHHSPGEEEPLPPTAPTPRHH